jgi:serine/threonine protein kinase
MTLKAGGRLGVYEIVAPIGAGGMGEVYRARDTRLDRSVAIKVLPAEFAQNAALRLRFEREAKTISSLSHPHICALFDVGDDYLVMELLDGESLAERLAKGPMTIDQVLKVGIEIAGALDSAHRQGIIHRDLKPANIMLTKTGAKLLDFGLAHIDANEATIVATTMQKPLTDAGTILGTFQYMAPEQVEAQAVDARTDIFALGAVLYEAATGKRAFEGKSRASLIAAILDHEPPPIATVRPLAPPSLDRVVRACLRKDPNERVQTAHDLMLDLTWIRESSSTGESLAVSAPRRRKPWALLATIAALAIITATLAAMIIRARNVHQPRTVYSILSPIGATNGDAVAVSPDGRAIAYYGSAGDSRDMLWVRRLSDPQPHAIPGTEKARFAFWSPDSRWLAFQGPSLKLRKVDMETGSVQQICDGDYGVGAAWGAGDTIVFAKRFGDGLYRVDAKGGEAAPLTKLNAARHESLHGWPKFLSDGRRFLFLIRTVADERNQIVAGSIDGGEPKLIMKADALVGFDAPYLLFVREGSLFAQEFDERALAVRGDAKEVVNSVSYSESWGTSSASVSKAGMIAYYPPYVPRVNVNLYDRRGAVVRTVVSDDAIADPVLSPDGKQLALTKKEPKKGATDVVVIDLARGVTTTITGGLATFESPSWSWDGKRVMFSSDSGGMYDLYAKAVDEPAPPVIVWKSDNDKLAAEWMRDGTIVAECDMPGAANMILVMPPGGKPRPLAKNLNGGHPAPSPDGRWIAFASIRPHSEVFVAAVDGTSVVQISTSGGDHPMWSADGAELFYVDPKDTLMAVPTKGSVGTPHALFQMPNEVRGMSVTKDGFLIAVVDEANTAPDHIDVITDWRGF